MKESGPNVVGPNWTAWARFGAVNHCKSCGNCRPF